MVQKEQVGADAACKLIMNFEKVVQDITNPGPLAVGGGQLTQEELKRVDPANLPAVRATVRAACCRLLGKEAPVPSTAEEAQVWMQAARFLGVRIQGSASEFPGREADMSAAAAAAMRAVLGQIEAGSKLMHNRDKVVEDITNPGARGVNGGQLSQKHLQRLPPTDKAAVNAMVLEVSGRLLGKPGSAPPPSADAQVWANAARFLGARIQVPSDWQRCESAGFPHRKADMSVAGAAALRTALGELEAALKLMSNRTKVVQDITNPGPQGLGGGSLTQLELKRLDSKHAATVDRMVSEVSSRLLGNEASGPSGKEEAQVWIEAAVFLAGRIQDPASECPGRGPDMSMAAAGALRTVLGQLEAASKLMSNHEKVVQDITNPGPSAVGGGQLTQLNLKRVDSKHQASVDKMVLELRSRLLGKTGSEPSSSDEARVWAQAARFFAARIQGSASECPGREADMSTDAVAAMCAVLAGIPNQTKNCSAAAAALLSTLSDMKN